MTMDHRIEKLTVVALLATSLMVQGVGYSERLGPRLESSGAETDDVRPVCSHSVLHPDMPPEFQSLVNSTDLDTGDDSDEEKECVTSVEHILHPQEDGFNNMQIVMPDGPDGTTVLKGEVEMDQEVKPLYQLGDVHRIGKGTTISMVMLDFVATGYSQGGDPVRAMVRKSIMADGKVMIPAGTMVHGHIADSEDPESLRRNGKLTIAFDYFQLPDGRQIKFPETLKKGDNAIKAIGRTVGSGLGGTLVGVVRGVMAGFKLAGLPGVAASHGLTLAAGAGLGAVGGLANGVAGSGDHVWFDEGDEIKVSLNQPIELPELITPSEKSVEIENHQLKVKVLDYKLGSDPFKNDNQIGLQVEIQNNTQMELRSFDIALMDETGDVYHITPFAGADTYNIHIPAKSSSKASVYFTVKNPALRHYLVIYKPNTQEILTRMSLREALKNLS